MNKKNEKYGVYYGELVEFDYTTHMIFSDWTERETSIFCEKLEECGVTEIMFDIIKNNCSDTMFFETNNETDYKKLMLEIHSKYPDEFTEETLNHFRIWMD